MVGFFQSGKKNLQKGTHDQIVVKRKQSTDENLILNF